jgi:hypothetical protein
MTPLIFSFLHGREIRLLEELSDRGIDTEKLTLSVLLDALGAAGLSLDGKKHQPWWDPYPLMCIPYQDPRRVFPMSLDDDNEDDN